VRFGFSAMGIVAFQTALFCHGLVCVHARLDLMAEETEIVALARHLESMLHCVFVLVAAFASTDV
jgi:hypothetical protein